MDEGKQGLEIEYRVKGGKPQRQNEFGQERKSKLEYKINLDEGKKTHGAFNLSVQVDLPPKKQIPITNFPQKLDKKPTTYLCPPKSTN